MTELKRKKQILVYILATILIFYGTAGLGGVITGIPLANRYLNGINTMSEINESVVAGFTSLSGTIVDASTTTKNAAQTIAEAKKSLNDASVLSEQAGTTFQEMSKYADFDILGYKPFANTSKNFNDIGSTLLDLSSQISNTADSLEVNINDVNKLYEDFIVISSKLDKISEVSSKTLTLIPIQSLTRAADVLFIYIALLHFMFIIIGAGMIFIIRN